MRLYILVLCIALFISISAGAKQDTTAKNLQNAALTVDSSAITKPVLDTLPPGIRMPDSLRHNRFIDTLLKRYAINPFDFTIHHLKNEKLSIGHERPLRNAWVILVILSLLVYAGLLNRIMSKDINNVVQAFYVKASFAKLSKEDNLLTSWAFICLFLLFGFTIGLYVYQLTLYYGLVYSISGLRLYLACSVLVVVLSVLKIMILRILAFIFDIHRLIREYVTVLYLTYFNIAFVFLPVVICFSLLPSGSIHYLLTVSVVLVMLVVTIQYIRSILNIISGFTFHKIYLFIYLCALEICPVLIVIKALNL